MLVGSRSAGLVLPLLILSMLIIAAGPAFCQGVSAPPQPKTEAAAKPVVEPAEAPVPPPPRLATAKELQPWQPQLAEVRAQFDLLKLFAQATQFKEMSITIPKEVQHIAIPELDERRIHVYLKKLKFHKLTLNHDAAPLWMQDHPAIASMLSFAKLGIAVEVTSPLGRSPVGCVFRNGKMPCDFDLTSSGYDMNIIPERTTDKARLGDVQIDFGGPLLSMALSKWFGKDLAQSILQFGAGQTLKMDREMLLGEPLGDQLVDKLLEELLD